MISYSYPNIIVGLCILVLVCIFFLYKKLWPSEDRRAVLAQSNGARSFTGNVNEGENDNLDLFKVRKANVGKSVKLTVENENKIYYLVELKNNKVLVMEEDIYNPEEIDQQMSMAFTEVSNIEVVDEEYVVEPNDAEQDALITGHDNVDELKGIVEEQNAAYEKAAYKDEQIEMFNVMGENPVDEDEYEQDEEED